MKKLILTFTLAGLFLFGCSDVGVNPKMPINSSTASTTTTLNKKGPNKDIQTHQFDMSLLSPVSVTQTINGEEGGTISLEQKWLFGGTSAKVSFPKNSFEGSKDITMMVDPLTATISFSPHIVFNKAVKLNLSFEGLNLEQLNLTKGKVYFYFQSDTGVLSLVENGGIKVKVKSGSVSVKNAQLHHFSRYLFAK